MCSLFLSGCVSLISVTVERSVFTLESAPGTAWLSWTLIVSWQQQQQQRGRSSPAEEVPCNEMMLSACQRLEGCRGGALWTYICMQRAAACLLLLIHSTDAREQTPCSHCPGGQSGACWDILMECSRLTNELRCVCPFGVVHLEEARFSWVTGSFRNITDIQC